MAKALTNEQQALYDKLLARMRAGEKLLDGEADSLPNFHKLGLVSAYMEARDPEGAAKSLAAVRRNMACAMRSGVFQRCQVAARGSADAGA